MKIVRAISIKSTMGRTGSHTEDGKFTGHVYQNELVDVKKASLPPSEANGIRILQVFFEPGAHTHWHRHPGGQVLHVVAGKGRVQEKESEMTEIAPGDTIYTLPNTWHWHGAAPDSFMIHIAINLVKQDIDERANHQDNWGDAPSDDDYYGKAVK